MESAHTYCSPFPTPLPSFTTFCPYFCTTLVYTVIALCVHVRTRASLCGQPKSSHYVFVLCIQPLQGLGLCMGFEGNDGMNGMDDMHGMDGMA
mmetsp:Transcript_121420/g.211061  ORF Transcript_121420/g.211061 Transcript_121420/m.211061 type:complete len:93 (+) Transcript_121420:12-290(+)